MKVYVEPIPATLSRAMHRVAAALRAHAPRGIQVTRNLYEADLQVLHAIGPDALEEVVAPRVATIQYCLYSAHGPASWTQLWRRSCAVWSYFDLSQVLPADVPFYRAPLGVDPAFHGTGNGAARYLGIVTSGYDSSPGAEAIEEVADAALRAGLSVFHVGPDEIKGMRPRVERTWQALMDMSDEDLARIYGCARWVSGLRRVEGFEFPVIEGLACGARPIVFDRHDMRQWYEGHAVFIPECDGLQLVSLLREVLERPPVPVTADEKAWVLERFDWARIIPGFWERAL